MHGVEQYVFKVTLPTAPQAHGQGKILEGQKIRFTTCSMYEDNTRATQPYLIAKYFHKCVVM